MNGTQAIRTTLKATQDLLGMYVNDLSDTDLLVRPTPNANHIAWQLGHLISSERMLTEYLPPGTYPELPAAFTKQHSKETAGQDPPQGFATKSEYLNLFNQTRKATLAALEKLSDADLDKPSAGRMKDFAPTLGALFLLVGNHTMMHTGQFTAVRRKLGKPVLF
jgi:hypothetical protein